MPGESCMKAKRSRLNSVETEPAEPERSIAVSFGYFGVECVEWATITGSFRRWNLVDWPLVECYTWSQLVGSQDPY